MHGKRMDARRLSILSNSRSRTEMGGLAEDELNHRVDRPLDP